METVVGMRELGPRDEDVLRALVRKVYGDYVESGMSLRHPALRPVTTDAEVWRRFFARIAGEFWIDLHTSAFANR